MTRYVTGRMLFILPTLVGVSVLVFLILHVTPGDPAEVLAGPDASEEDLALVRESMGLNDPLPEQYWRFLGGALRGDLGRSYKNNQPVLPQILDRFPKTVELSLVSMLIAIVAGMSAGIASAVKPYSVFDTIASVGGLLGLCIPEFWLGLLLLLLFSLRLGWFPASGRSGPIWTLGGIQSIILPASTLGLTATAYVMRITRSAMLEVIRQEYITTARAKGLSEMATLFGHALKNALIPVVTLVGIQFGNLLSGTIIVESVFAWPGMGRLLVWGIWNRDYPMVQGCVLVMATVFVFINTAVDILYSYLDPRIRYE